MRKKSRRKKKHSQKATECPEVPTVQSPLCEVLYTRTTTILDKVDTGEDESEEEDERKDDDDQEAGEEYDDPGREEEEGNGATGLHSDECPTSNKSEDRQVADERRLEMGPDTKQKKQERPVTTDDLDIADRGDDEETTVSDRGSNVSIIYTRTRSDDESESNTTGRGHNNEEETDDSDIFVEDIEDIPEDDEDNWYEKSRKRYDHEEDADSKDNILNTNVFTEGIELTDKFIDKFSNNTLQRGDFYSFESEGELMSRCRNNPHKYMQCTVDIQSAHRAVATPVKSSSDVGTIDILGRSKCGQAFTDDVVVVEILDNHATRQRNETNDNKTYGKVIGILERTRHAGIEHPVFISVLDKHDGHLMLPLCKTIPKLNVLRPRNQEKGKGKHTVRMFKYDSTNGVLLDQGVRHIKPEERHQYRFVVCYLFWGIKYVYPRGAVIGMVKTSSTDIQTDVRIIGIQNQAHTMYNESTVRDVQRLLVEHKSLFSPTRQDLTNHVIAVTIDPPFSKDLDDALSIDVLPGSEYLVGVHIADVASVVAQNGDTDKEARLRCSTFYPCNNVKPLHMLPEPLSQDLLSLVPNEKRRTISVFFRMKKNGILSGPPDIQRTLIQSRKRLTYQEAQDIIEGKCNQNDHVNLSVRLLYNLSRYISLGRSTNAFPVECVLSPDSNDVIQNRESHRLVEAFMLLANHAVGQYLTHTYTDVVPLRRQSEPHDDVLLSWLDKNTHLADIIIQLQDKPMPATNNEERTLEVENSPPARWNRVIPIQSWVWKSIVSAVKENDFSRVRQLIGTDDLHPQQSFALQEWMSCQDKARYQCSGSVESPEKGGHHFSLGISSYVHFTSPIRRYVDIVIHRLLHAALDGKDKPPYDRSEIDDICKDMNRVNERSTNYQKQCNLLSLSVKLKKRPTKLIGFVEEISNEGVTLHFPGLHKIPKQKRLLRFNLLDVSSQPTTKIDLDLLPPNTTEDRQLTSVMWQKRIYLHKDLEMKQNREQNKKDAPSVPSINPHQRTMFLKYTCWINILKALVSHDKPELCTLIEETAEDIQFGATNKYVKSCLNGVNDISSENMTSFINNQPQKFKLPFHLNQTVAVQMTADYDRGTLLPYIQVLDMTRNLSFCLQHVDDAVKFLARYSTVPTKLEYRNPHDYLGIWIPIIHMEAAKNAVHNEESTSIVGIPMELQGRRGKFYLNAHYCKIRDIEFGNTALNIFENEDDETRRATKTGEKATKDGKLKDIVCSNYMCIRCPISEDMQQDLSRSVQGGIPDEKRMWIGHGEMTQIRKTKTDIAKHCFEIHFQLHHDNVPAPMRKTQPTDGCILEILMKSKVDRRIETVVKMLPEATLLAKCIALAKQIPKLGELHNEIAARVPNDVMVDVPLPWNNQRQDSAIQNALRSRFSLIQGPPGTGKTFTGIKLIYLFTLFNQLYSEKTLEKRQLVFSGPSNISVDLVAKQALQRLGNHAPRMIRMYGQAYESKDFPVPGKVSYSHRSIRDSKPDSDLVESGIVLHHVVREDGKTYANELKDFDKKFKDGKYTPNWSDTDKYQEILSKATQEELKNYDVILCTTSMTANPKFLKATKDRVYQCVIDECGMCTEPECMMPIIATQAEQVVLIGDHKQLQPIIICKEAQELGLGTSLFERYTKLKKNMNKLNVKYTMLNWQYRMNPHICEFPSNKFYDGKLKTAKSRYWQVEFPLKIWNNADPEAHVPLAFCHIEGSVDIQTVSTEEGNDRSRKNMAEATHVVRVFKYLVEVEKVDIKYIQIITQYNAQRHAIQETLRDEERFINIKVRTVVKSQGSEWDYVIFSTVSSLPRCLIEPNPTRGWCIENLGFITDQHQVNVALTRARKGLIIIGNKNLLRCDDKVWKDLIAKYESEGLMFTPQQFPPTRGQGHRQVQRTRPPRFQNNN